MIFKIIGIALIIFGVVDFGGSWAGFDLWGSLGIQLPEVLWQFSAYIELALGFVIMKLAPGSDEEAEN